MKIYIVTDLEGSAGVNRWVQTREGETPEKARAMRLLTRELNAAIAGILDADPEAEVIVFDGHGPGGLVFELLHPRAQTILHGRFTRDDYLLDESFDALFFVGQHAMAGVAKAPLCHTYSSRTVEHYKINGEFIGEIGCRALLAGSYGVPTVFLSGDDKACVELNSLVPDAVTVATKQGLGVELALHLSPREARERIRQGAAEATRRAKGLPPYFFAAPYEQEFRVYKGCSLDSYLQRGAEKIDERTAILRTSRLSALFL